ncbi:hypothetical protein ACLBR5_26870 [Escherichia coli]
MKAQLLADLADLDVLSTAYEKLLLSAPDELRLRVIRKSSEKGSLRWPFFIATV